MGSPEGKSIISNPVAVHDTNNQTIVFCLCDDGQVYYQQQDADRLVDFGKWLAIGSKIPFEAGGTEKNIIVRTYFLSEHECKLMIFL